MNSCVSHSQVGVEATRWHLTPQARSLLDRQQASRLKEGGRNLASTPKSFKASQLISIGTEKQEITLLGICAAGRVASNDASEMNQATHAGEEGS